MTNQLTFFLAFFFSISLINAQSTFPRNGVADHREGLYAFTNATIYKSYNEKLDNATMIIRNGKVEAIGQGIQVPADAVLVDCLDKTIYPSFIEMYSSYGMPEAKRGNSTGGRSRSPQPLSDKDGAYSWNEALKPEFRAHENFTTKGKDASELRKLGFGAVLTHRMDGISRGTSTLVSLGNEREHEVILEEEVGHHLSFRKGTSSQNYPSSLMGAIALLKQTYYDAQWYKDHGHKEEVNISLDNWNAVQNGIQIFEVGDRLEALRASKIGKEFGITYIIKGSGDEYQRIEELQKTQSAFIIPVNFPDAYDVEDPYDASLVTLQQMKHWELAPTNVSRLAKAGIKFALTTSGLQKKSDFFSNVQKAIKNGLSEEDALKAMTQTPAELMEVANRLGSLDQGKIANFIITDGNIFKKGTKIHHNWVQGKPFVIKSLEKLSLEGHYGLSVNGEGNNMKVKDDGDKYKMTLIIDDSTTIDVKNKVENGRITMSFTPHKKRGLVRLAGTIGTHGWSGNGQDSNGDWVSWNVVPRRPPVEDEGEEKKEKKDREDRPSRIGQITYPFMAFGWKTRPEAKTYLLKNGTVWTNESEGIMENADVLMRNGKIVQVGQNLSAAGAIEIDATGKHITSGVIDEHTHIGASRGINEGTQASSAEVSIGDVVNSEDINIYRQLSGGVTAAQILHGSANPIGGQSGLIKFRWGFAPEEMKIQNADGFIKFALGENVKQSNRSGNYTTRFPQTRMGVEQLYDDHFTRAAEYGKLKKSGKPYRKDLEMETLLEILESKRFISCHSYVQSEINMLMKVAEKHNFRINTFTHILEGYKVADIMAKHGAGGSSFSDWWAYKFEVYNAIPYNGAIMHEQGVTVAFNSDDAEMARRLNQEAAKAVLFGGVSEEEAWKFVTLNPAKLLHLDDRMGSLKSGKDADVVVWSENPLSVYSKAEITFVDGIKFFDRAVDLKLREEVKKERNRLTQKMLEVKKGGGKTRRPFGRRGMHYHCDDVEDEMH